MPSINRGSQHRLLAIAEATYGVTPATPAMQEIPIVDFSKSISQDQMTSDQLRSHPYVDRILTAGLTYDLTCTTELQDAAHDLFFQMLFANTIVSKAMKFADGLSSATLESQAGGGAGSAMFDDFTGAFWSKLDVSLSADDTKPIKCSWSGQAIAGVLDAATTISASVTAATFTDPFVYAGGTVTLAGVARPVTAANFSISREVTPLNVLGTTVARYYVPGAVTVTGSITIPYEDTLESARLTAFADVPIVLKCSSADGSKFRQFSIPATKIVRMQRQVNTRGGMLQQIDFVAKYDTTSLTVMTLTTQ